MSDLFANKIAAALLASALGFIGINKIAGAVVQADIPAVPAYRIAVIEDTGHAEELPLPFPSAAFIAALDPAKGEKVFKKCTSCHNANDGGKNGTGPALWNVVGRATGSVDGFSYSTGMTALGGTWGYEELDKFLAKPKDFVPKTKMAFIGLKKESDRAALIAFLRLRSSAPIEAPIEAAPLPEHDMAEDMVEEVVENLTPDTHVEIPAETPVEETHAPEGGH